MCSLSFSLIVSVLVFESLLSILKILLSMVLFKEFTNSLMLLLSIVFNSHPHMGLVWLKQMCKSISVPSEGHPWSTCQCCWLFGGHWLWGTCNTVWIQAVLWTHSQGMKWRSPATYHRNHSVKDRPSSCQLFWWLQLTEHRTPESQRKDFCFTIASLATVIQRAQPTSKEPKTARLP